MSLMSWGMYPRIKSSAFRFDTNESLKEIISTHSELISYGNGRSYGDSALGTNILEVRPHNYFLDFDEESGLLHLQAGVLLSEILESFVPRGWFLTITPGTKLITVGGAIASDVHGKNHHVRGCFSECVKDFEIMLASGEIVTCSREKTPELFRATCGGQGLTGVILTARIRLTRIHSSYIDQTTIKSGNLEDTFKAFEEYRDFPYSVAWIDCLAKGADTGRGLLMAGDFRNDGKFSYEKKREHSVPFNFPAVVLNKWSIKVFNRLYYSKAKSGGASQVVDIDDFFYPLDALSHWNRIYGKRGFIQYHFVLPKEHGYQGIKEVLNIVAGKGKGSFLAVLKLCGMANDNYLSFPMEGYSLALDFRIEAGLFQMLDELDQIILKYKGRIYLAKDARVRKEVFEKGYPHVDTFRQYRKNNNMIDTFESSQSKRLEI
ncbi:FAD-binding oxidoreductase [Thiolapillus brandeum]|uniref:Oxidoreductase n=1 Tax=Thiolapillus brandeum TaxID=1076588 RepID=A0A7U6GKL5_9GAMM|nr:FAD-binding oxidoreductase [Thiolapillus brandeum]BAO45318.1 oxidoreductase [Thiolapillus brandeum]